MNKYNNYKMKMKIVNKIRLKMMNNNNYKMKVIIENKKSLK